jgi:hypothetical protein
MLYSPSKLGKLRLCPKFDYVPIEEDPDDTTSVTARGTILHEAYATGEMSGLTEDEIGFIGAALTMDEAEMAMLPQPVTVHKELKVQWTPLNLMGTLDKVFISGDYAKVRDLKTGPAGLPEDADDSVQVIAYILGVYEAFPQVNRCDGDLLNPRTRENSESIITTRADIPALEAKLREIIDGREDMFAEPRPGSHCRDCKYIARCHGFSPNVKTVAKFAFPIAPEVFDPTCPKTPEEWGMVSILRQGLEAWCEAIKAAANASGITPPGFKRINKEGTPTIPKENRGLVMAALRELGLDQEQLDVCCRPTLGDVIAIISAAQMLGKEAAKRRVYDALQGFMRTSPMSYLQRDKKSLSDADVAAMLQVSPTAPKQLTMGGNAQPAIDTTAS